MYLGIDVGGTFTDGIILDGSRVVKTVKKPTRRDELQQTLMSVLEELLQAASASKIERAVISTTLVTNLIATGRAEPAALILVPGPGMPRESFTMFPNTFFLEGSIDFRGRKVEALNQAEMEQVINQILAEGFVNIGVISKFSNRNPAFEDDHQAKYTQKGPTRPGISGLRNRRPVKFPPPDRHHLLYSPHYAALESVCHRCRSGDEKTGH